MTLLLPMMRLSRKIVVQICGQILVRFEKKSNAFEIITKQDSHSKLCENVIYAMDDKLQTKNSFIHAIFVIFPLFSIVLEQ